MTGSPVPALEIRKAVEADVPLIIDFIRKLAEYERMSEKFASSEEHLHDALFGTRPVAETLALRWQARGLRVVL